MTGFRTRLPPTNALVVFEAVARHLSFTAAARELGVSQAATSRQVRLLEDHLSVRLFSREHRQIRLTPAGAELHQAVTLGLGHIAAVTDGLRAGRRDRSFTIATSIAFSAFWLMPRIGRFHAAQPEIELRLVTSDSESEWPNDGVDVAVAFGRGQGPGFTAERLFGDEIIAVCHPDYLAGRPPPGEAAALCGETLLHLDSAHLSRLGWKAWLARCGVAARDLPGRRFNTYTIAIQAARDGQGVALGWRRLIDPDLAAGTLMRLTAASVVPEDAYYLLVPERLADDPRVRAFRDWILAEAAEDWQ